MHERPYKILFIMNELKCGGVERSFMSALSLFASPKYDVTLVVIDKSGVFVEELPSWVHVHELPLLKMDRYEYLYGRTAAVKYAIAHGLMWYALKTMGLWLLWMLSGRRRNYHLLSFQRMVRRVKLTIPTKYDCVFAYGGMYPSSVVALELFKAPLMTAWFHLETQAEREGQEFYDKLYRHFQRRFCCSARLAEQLNSSYCQGEKRFEKFTYYLNPRLYRELANQDGGFSDDFKGIRLLTVGRLEYQKGYDLAIEAMNRLKRSGYNVRWYVIGWGGKEDEYRRMIAERELQDDFILLGLNKNPYAYFSQCDIYVQPSRYEGYCLTVAEARAFNRPIVCTDFAGASEQIRSGENGLIVSTISVDAIFDGIKKLLDNANLREQFSLALSKEQVDTEVEVAHAWEELVASSSCSKST